MYVELNITAFPSSPWSQPSSPARSPSAQQQSHWSISLQPSPARWGKSTLTAAQGHAHDEDAEIPDLFFIMLTMDLKPFGVGHQNALKTQLLPTQPMIYLTLCISIFIIMHQTISSKRRAFHELIRNQQIQKMFTAMRVNMLSLQPSNTGVGNYQLVNALPKSVFEINQKIPTNQQCQSQLIELLINGIDKWIWSFEGQSLYSWYAGMQILMKILNSCSNEQTKIKIIAASQRPMVGAGFKHISSNKMLKYQILMVILNYYIAALNQPSCLIDDRYLKDLFPHILKMNWKVKTNQVLTFVFFMNGIVDKASSSGEKGLSMLFGLFIEDPQVLIKLMGIIEQTFMQSTVNIYEQLVSMILRLFINLSVPFKQQKLNRIFMKTSFIDLIIQRINSGANHLRQYFLQLICNILVDQHQFRNIIRNQLNFELLSDGDEIYIFLVEQIKHICWPQQKN